MPSDLAPQLARGASWVALRGLVAFAALLGLTPFVVGRLGPERYGLWALAAVIAAYAQLSDLGIADGLVKFAAEHREHGDAAGLTALVNTALAAYLGLALLVGGLLGAAMPALAEGLFRVPPPLQAEAVLVFRLAVAAYLVNLVAGVFTALLVGALRLGVASAVGVGAILVNAAGTVHALRSGWGLAGLGATALATALLAGVVSALAARRAYPALRLAPWRLADRATLRRLLGFGWKVQASSVAQLLTFQLDRILLSRFLGLPAVASYDVGSTAASQARGFLAGLLSPLTPAASRLQAAGDQAALAGLYRRAFKLAAAAVLPAFLVLSALAGPLVRLWVGPGFEAASTTLSLLAPAYAVNVLTAPGGLILTGAGRPELPMRTALVGAALNLALCWTLVRWLGYLGLVAGICAALLLSAALFLRLLHRSLGGLGTAVYREVALGPLAWGLGLAGAAWGLQRALDLTSLAALAALVAGCGAALAALLWRTRYLDPFERHVLSILLRSAQGRS